MAISVQQCYAIHKHKTMSRYIDIQTAAKLLNLTERGVRKQCLEGRLPGARLLDGQWKIPADSHPKFSVYRAVGDRVDDRLLTVPADKLEEAMRKVGLLQDFERFSGELVRANKSGRSENAVIFCQKHNIPPSTFRSWQFNFKREGVAGLVDTRGRGGKPVGQPTISDGAWQLFQSLYLDQRRPSIAQVHRLLTIVNKQENHNWIIPSLRTLQSYVADNIPLPVQVLHREGTAAYDARCAPYVITDPDSVEPGQIWIGDHHQFNAMIRHKNTWVRPWVTAWEDMRSRAIVGWYISLSPNQTTILQAFRRGCEQFGPPESVKIDNGKDYDSQLFTGQTKAQRRKIQVDEKLLSGIFGMMNIDVSFAIPYHPQSKAIERFFDTLDQQFTNTIPTYCGKDSSRKPEDLNDFLKSAKGLESAISLEKFAELVEQYIVVYNQSAHTGGGMNGQTPQAVLASRQSRRVLQDGVLDLVCRVWSPELTVGKNGVRFKGVFFGQYDTALMAYQGKKVRLSYNPDDLSRVFVYDSKYRLICTAEQAKMIAYGRGASDSDLREAMAAKARAKRLVKQSRDLHRIKDMDLTDLAISAMQNAAPQATAPKRTLARTAAVKPVSTPLDGQVKHHHNLLQQKLLKRAVGAENKVDLHIDIDAELAARQYTPRKLEMFDD